MLLQILPKAASLNEATDPLVENVSEPMVMAMSMDASGDNIELAEVSQEPKVTITKARTTRAKKTAK